MALQTQVGNVKIADYDNTNTSWDSKIGKNLYNLESSNFTINKEIQ